MARREGRGMHLGAKCEVETAYRGIFGIDRRFFAKNFKKISCFATTFLKNGIELVKMFATIVQEDIKGIVPYRKRAKE